ncbi:MAG: S8 family serine peptidase [Alphaproteobacteria bacterium]|nr:S8 family serine peptidase [Alphaproteobacteria bacterium]
MTKYRTILTAILCGTLCCAPVLAADNCDDALYRRYNPDKCTHEFRDSGFSFASTAAVVSGTAALIGGTIALLGGSSDKGDTSSAPHSTLPTYTMVGGDVDSVHLSSIFSDTNYASNANQYNDIRVAYSLARGYTGKNSDIAVFDSNELTDHGANVAALAGGTIAPDANVNIYTVARSQYDFDSFYTIGNTIQNATDNGANIYNFSWSANIYANQVRSRYHMEQMTDKNFIKSLTNAATQNDAIFVWAAGNDGNSQSSALSAMPLHIPELNGHFVNVVAWDSETGSLAYYSNECGITKNYCITAPGSDIYVSATDETISGTSFATPIVSAAIAVIREAFPYMKSNQITALLFETARDIGEVGVDTVYGHGMLDLERAPRPVGAELVPLSDGMTVALRTAHMTGGIAHNVKSENIKFAFVDSYGRAFDANLNDNISIKNRGIGFERLHDNKETNMHFGNIEFGFKNTELLKGDGFLSTDSQNMITFIGLNNSVQFGRTALFSRTTIGTMNPTASAESMINGFSRILTGSITLGATAGDWTFTFGTTDTIIDGNMYLRAPTGRRVNGDYTFANHSIDMTSRPSIEVSASYKFMTAGFVDNPFGTDELYFIAKTKLQF